MWRIRRMNEMDVDNVHTIETDVHIAPWSRNIIKDCVLVGYNCLVLEIKVHNNWYLGGYIISRHSGSCCHILNFCIARHLQSQGYGRKFLHYFLNSLSQLGSVDHAILEVRPSNKVAMHLYETMGFKPQEIKPGYYKDNGTVEDAILLKKIVP